MIALLDCKVTVACLERGISAQGVLNNDDSSRLLILLDEPVKEIPFLYQEHVTLKVFDPVKGERTFEADVLSCLSDRITLENAAHISTKQRRSDSRVDTTIETKVSKLQMIGQEEVALPENKYLPITLFNISAGGILVYSPLKLPPNVRLTLTLPIQNLEVKVQVIRVIPNSEGMKYGCKFVEISEDDRMAIRQFVFKEQMEQRRKKKL